MSSHPVELIGCDPIRTGGIPSRLASRADAAAANVMADGAMRLMPFISYLRSHHLRLSAGRIEVNMSMEPFAEGPSRWSSSSRSPSGVLERPGSLRDVRTGPDASVYVVPRIQT